MKISLRGLSVTGAPYETARGRPDGFGGAAPKPQAPLLFLHLFSFLPDATGKSIFATEQVFAV